MEVKSSSANAPYRSCIILSLLCVTTATLYHVIPDDDYYSISNNSFTLHHYLNNANKYFISDNQLQFLPGHYNLTGNILIEDVKNFLLTGSRANGVINTVITCTGPYGVVVINSDDIIIANIVIEECNLLDHYNASLLLLNSWYISVLNVQLLRVANDELSLCTFQALNIFGNSVLSNLKANCLEIYYDAIDDNLTSTSVLYIRNYQTDFMSSNVYFITIVLGYALYNIKVVISRTIFTKSSAIDYQCYGFQGYSTIKIQDSIFTNITELYGLSLVNVNTENCVNENKSNKKSNKITFIDCSFVNNVFTTGEILLNINVEIDLKEILYYSGLRIYIIDCTFQFNQNGGLISVEYFKTGEGHGYSPRVFVTGTTFSYITLRDCSNAIYMVSATLILHKSVINHVNAHNESSIIKKTQFFSYFFPSSLHFTRYVEISECSVNQAAIIAEYVYIDEYTVVNFTANDFPILFEIGYNSADPATILTPMMLIPCIFQYDTSSTEYLDTKFLTGSKLNYTIFFISNNIDLLSTYKYSISYCGWVEETAFLHIRASDINKNVIQYINDSLEYDKVRKEICFCDNKDKSGYDCYREDIGPYYPGQTVTLYFITVFMPVVLQKLLIKIEDGPETACSTKNKSIITLLPYQVCKEFKYTIQHKSGKECDLYIRGIQLYNQGYSASPVYATIEYFYVTLLPCPTGFTLLKSDGLCQCDPVLLAPAASIKVCNINDQTILRQPNSWITGTTINNSHTYNVSSLCPFDYCSPHSSYINPSNPDSQCQFNRTGVLCGQCQQGLSAVLGSSQCRMCSSIYLLLVIPIAVAGIALVIVLFVLNLTVTDGDINAFLLYVNILSINTPVFFPKERFIKYALISLANLDLGIETCFYDGMDDYAKMWLQLTFPAYLILIATTLIMASRYSIRIQRLTARRALPVLATLFLLSYTKVLHTISSVLFFYYKITNLPSKHTTIVWAVDTSALLFGIKFTFIFVVSLFLFLILLYFNIILVFTRLLSYFKCINRFKPILDAYQGPYKDKYYFWTGLQLVMRAIFFGLSALDRNTNLMISSILLATASSIHGAVFPFKNNAKNIQELLMMLNLNCLFILTLYTTSNDIAVTILVLLAFMQLLLIFINHIRIYLLSFRCISLAMMKADTIIKKYFCCFKSPPLNNIDRGNLEMIPEVAYNFREFREPLIGQDA